jgi:hypothetical protein
LETKPRLQDFIFKEDGQVMQNNNNNNNNNSTEFWELESVPEDGRSRLLQNSW